MTYLFTSARLGFRNWMDSDFESFHAITSDPEVMRFFPSISTEEQTRNLIQRMQHCFTENGYCYYAIELLETKELLGFIGIAKQTYEAEFTPCIDIGWRLKKTAWGKGYATEGAKRCLEYAFHDLGLTEILSVASLINEPSINVMKKIGMTFVKKFEHPLLLHQPRLKQCVLYKIKSNS